MRPGISKAIAHVEGGGVTAFTETRVGLDRESGDFRHDRDDLDLAGLSEKLQFSDGLFR